MDASLSTYHRKRDFGATPEPEGRVRSHRGKLQYVIQRHQARHLHYDFRLELDGVLKSWAVPKGPSERVGDRRLAVQVEDHPVQYANFEGDIPPGQYGAGRVDIWDRGTWTPIGDARAGLRDGHLKFELSGERLHGRWALVRFKHDPKRGKDDWLLVRERPSDAVPRKRTRARKADDEAKPKVAGVAISNANRVIRDSGDVTKLDVVRYYEAVATAFLPQVKRRPLAVIKCPGGNFANCFFQRHPTDPDNPARTQIDSPPYLRLDSLADVISTVQNGVFEFHSWGAHFPRVDRPDRIILDLDPDVDLSWPTLREACELTRALLDRLELRWFLKTTGGKGFHFVVPLVPRDDWDDVKAFARGLATTLAKASPQLFVSTASKARRGGRVFVDYLRNADGATAVAAYSLRARPGLPVSMPIAWSALREDVRGTCFTVRNVPQIIKRRKSDPWADYEAARQKISKAARTAVGA